MRVVVVVSVGIVRLRPVVRQVADGGEFGGAIRHIRQVVVGLGNAVGMRRLFGDGVFGVLFERILCCYCARHILYMIAVCFGGVWRGVIIRIIIGIIVLGGQCGDAARFVCAACRGFGCQSAKGVFGVHAVVHSGGLDFGIVERERIFGLALEDAADGLEHKHQADVGVQQQPAERHSENAYEHRR